MKSILAAATLALMVGTSSLVSAQAATAELKPYTMDMSQDMRASDLLGQRVYATDMDVENRTLSTTELADFDDIGEIDDVVMTRDGTVKAVVLGVGGFLGLGERDVTVELSSLRFVQETDGEGSFIVVNATKDQLMALADGQKAERVAAEAEAMDAKAEETADAAGAVIENTGDAVAESTETVVDNTVEVTKDAANAVEETAEAATAEVAETAEAAGTEMKEAATATAETVEQTAEAATAEVKETAEAATTEVEQTADAATAEVTETTRTVEIETAEATDTAPAAATMEREVLVRPQVMTEGYADVATNELTVDDLTGKRIYGVDGEDVGEIADLVLGSDGQTIERAVLDIGGFLGLGERRIAVPLDELQFTRNADGDMRVFIQATQEQLENQPEYAAE